MTILAIFLSAFFGALGWIIARLVFEPLNEIINLRREAQELLIIYGDLSKDAPPPERQAAGEAFRRIGAGLVSRHVASYSWVRWCCTRLGYDIHSAGQMLIDIGKATQFGGFSSANASPIVPLIRQSLRLPAPQPSPLMTQLHAHAAAPAPLHSNQP